MASGGERLQWGHVLSDVEIRDWNPAPQRDHSASMGPRPFRRGNILFFDGFERNSLRLQWGHVLSDVEIPNPPIKPLTSLLLQWGHVLSDVEIMGVEAEDARTLWASMGPRPFRRGNGVYMAGEDKNVTLQWGHVLSDVEIVDTCHTAPPGKLLQWGHVLSDVEIQQGNTY